MSVYPSRALKVPNQPLWLCLGLAFTNFFCLLLILMALSNLADRVSDVERTMNTTSTMLEVADTKITKTTLYQSTLYGMMKETREAVENEAKKLAGKIEGLTELSREYNSMLLEELKKGKTVTVFKHEDIDYLRVLMKENREAVENEGKKLAGKIEGLTGLSREHNSMLLEELKKGKAFTVTKHEDIDYLRVLVADLERKKGVYTTGKVEHVTDSEVVFKYSPSPSFGDPAHCFPLKGSNGFVEIRFEHAMVFDSITLEHVTNSNINRSSAPKLCFVYGGLRGPASENDTTSATTDVKNLRLLTGFFYDPNKGNAQTFDVLNLAASNIVDTIRFDFVNNHGHDNYTCIYGLRVNGHAPA